MTYILKRLLILLIVATESSLGNCRTRLEEIADKIPAFKTWLEENPPERLKCCTLFRAYLNEENRKKPVSAYYCSPTKDDLRLNRDRVSLTWVEPDSDAWSEYEAMFLSAGKETITVKKTFPSRAVFFSCIDGIFCLSSKEITENDECKKLRPQNRNSEYCRVEEFSDLTPVSQSCNALISKNQPQKKPAQRKPATQFKDVGK